LPYSEQSITSVQRWSPKTFSFTATRPEGFEFENGQFVTLGLRREGKLVPRAYSIVSDPREPDLEFLSIHVPDGALTSQLAELGVGDHVWINSKVTGSLTLDHVQPGTQSVPAGDRNRPRAVHFADPRREGVRALRTGDPGAQRAYRGGAELPGGDRGACRANGCATFLP
jgi:hypothetical protein